MRSLIISIKSTLMSRYCSSDSLVHHYLMLLLWLTDHFSSHPQMCSHSYIYPPPALG